MIKIGSFVFFCKRQIKSYKTPFLKSYSFAMNDINLLFNICISNGLAITSFHRKQEKLHCHHSSEFS